MIPDRHFDSEEDLRRYEALLAMADVMVRDATLPELFRELADRLHAVVSFDLANFSLHDSQKNVMRIHVFEGMGSSPAPGEVSIDTSPGGWAWQNQQSLLLPHKRSVGQFEKFLEIMGKKGIRSYCALPMTAARRRLGALGLGSSRADAYREEDLRFLHSVAKLVALTLESHQMRSDLQDAKDRSRMLLEVGGKLMSTLDMRKLFPEISALIRKVVPQDYANLMLWDETVQSLRLHALDSPAEGAITGGAVTSIEGSMCGRVCMRGKTKIFNGPEIENFECGVIFPRSPRGLQSACCIPLLTRKGPIGTLNLGSETPNAFHPRDLDFLREVASQIAVAIDNAKAYQEIADLTERLKTEKLYLEDEIRSTLDFEDIVGESPALKQVLAQVNTVSPSDATVLILGETGTGKELIARAIHRMSSRKDASFIKLNCAAIPTGLLESELFGHEKGAFTGAVSQKIGRLELADKGTLFLDEVGDIPLELQPKLLRVLQDQEFERLGGIRTIKVHVRLIAATNRDLVKRVAASEFRSDLYYRLHVFPVRMPPLRERRDDIPMLVRYFVQRFARAMDKHIEDIPADTMQALKNWHWPGNIRELENFLERSVILSTGTVLSVPLAELRPVQEGALHVTLEGLQRDHILRVLRETGGVIAGVRGAAARLGMKRTTLQSRMQKMGITRAEFEN